MGDHYEWIYRLSHLQKYYPDLADLPHADILRAESLEQLQHRHATLIQKIRDKDLVDATRTKCILVYSLIEVLYVKKYGCIDKYGLAVRAVDTLRELTSFDDVIAMLLEQFVRDCHPSYNITRVVDRYYETHNLDQLCELLCGVIGQVARESGECDASTIEILKQMVGIHNYPMDTAFNQL